MRLTHCEPRRKPQTVEAAKNGAAVVAGLPRAAGDTYATPKLAAPIPTQVSISHMPKGEVVPMLGASLSLPENAFLAADASAPTASKLTSHAEPGIHSQTHRRGGI